MKRANWILNSLALAISLLGTGNLLAAEKSTPKDVPEPSAAAAWQRRVADFSSDGIPLDEIVKRLRGQFPELNFIVREKARSEGVSLMLRAVTLEEILKAIPLGTEGRVRVISPTNADDRLVIFDKGPGQGAAIDPATGLPMPGGNRDEKVCRVFNLSRYLRGRDEKNADAAIRQVIESLETAWMMLRQANADQEEVPKLNLHRGTKLLIAVGRPADLDILEQVVKELQGSGDDSFNVTLTSASHQLSLDLMRERAAQADSLVLLRQKEADLERAQQLYDEKPPIISKTQYQLAKSAVDALKATISARSNLIERLEADVKHFSLPEQGRGVRSGKD